ncbi:MAG: hypothetical protein U9N36_11250 [Euryarchaeota archaeon]|nr:hypothetical protein [Euryarchaeota archaeon]
MLGGRVWRTVRGSFERLYVKPAKERIATAKFKSHASEGAFSHMLPAHLRVPESKE